jgi:hypothetical protein
MPYRPYSPSKNGTPNITTVSRMREVLFLIGEDGAVLWSDASNSPVSLPDSRARWQAIWSRRERIVEIAHSHPVGPLAFSREDETTMRALTSALGHPLLFSVVAPSGMVRRRELVDGSASDRDREEHIVEQGPWWTRLLRLASGMTDRPPIITSREEAHASSNPRRTDPWQS